jgi:MFS family permease
VHHDHALLTGALAVTAVLFVWSFRLPGAGVVVPYMLTLGFVSNLVPTAAFTLAPRSVRSAELAGPAMAALTVVSSLGILIGPPLVGAIVGRGQWGLASAVLAVAAAVGAAAGLVAWALARRHGRRPGEDRQASR